MNDIKKKILHVLVRLDYGGIETWLVNVLQNYDKNKFQMDVCLVGRRGITGILAEQAIATGSSLYVIPLRNLFHFATRIWNLFSKYDVVFVHTAIYIAIPVLLTAYWAGVKHRLLMLHNTRFSIPLKWLERRKHGLLFDFAAFVCNSFNKALATKIIGCSIAALDSNYPGWANQQFAQVLHYGVDTYRFRQDANGKGLKESLGIPDNALVLGHIGRFSPQKNHFNFISVARYLYTINADLHFLLVGDGTLRGEIEQQIKNAGLQDRFHLTGIRKDIPNLMSIMDLAYFPSFHEGFPVTFIEAQVNGLLVVTTTRPEMYEAICPENHPWCLSEPDQIKMNGDLIHFLLSKPDLRRTLALRAQAWANERFSIQQSTLSMENILIQQLEGG